jgi:hypothetical protein
VNMKVLLLLLVSATLLWAAPPPSSTWVLYKWGNSGKYNPYSTTNITGTLASFNFPQTGNNVAYPAFLTTTTDSSVLGDLTGQTITASIDLGVTGNPQFRYGGQGSWNLGGTPANTRLFISTSSAPYSNAGYTACPSCYWWSAAAWVQISATTGAATLQDTFDPSHWSNAQGQLGSSLPAEFATAISNVRQIGLSYGGGSFYDVGIAVTNGTGMATFHLISYDAQ